MPALKFATHLLLADTQENITYMNFDFSKQKVMKFPIKEKTQTSLINYDEILYLECTGHLVLVYHTRNNKPVFYTNSLVAIEEGFTNYGFLRINNNIVVNMYYVYLLNSRKHEIHLRNDKILSVSRRKWKKIAEFFNS